MSSYPGQKKVFSSTDNLIAEHVRALLNHHGLEAVVKNTDLADIGLPRLLAPIEVWVIESQFESAQEILNNSLSKEVSDSPNWLCKQCNESIEGQFTECWNCGSSYE